jgi:hypothetical protein
MYVCIHIHAQTTLLLLDMALSARLEDSQMASASMLGHQTLAGINMSMANSRQEPVRPPVQVLAHSENQAQNGHESNKAHIHGNAAEANQELATRSGAHATEDGKAQNQDGGNTPDQPLFKPLSFPSLGANATGESGAGELRAPLLSRPSVPPLALGQDLGRLPGILSTEVGAQDQGKSPMLLALDSGRSPRVSTSQDASRGASPHEGGRLTPLSDAGSRGSTPRVNLDKAHSKIAEIMGFCQQKYAQLKQSDDPASKPETPRPESRGRPPIPESSRPGSAHLVRGDSETNRPAAQRIGSSDSLAAITAGGVHLGLDRAALRALMVQRTESASSTDKNVLGDVQRDEALGRYNMLLKSARKEIAKVSFLSPGGACVVSAPVTETWLVGFGPFGV